jgi:TrmH family RNA methyltransferase
VRLSSAHNPVIKYVRSLERAAVRREGGVYLAEGVRLLREAIATKQTATLVLYDREILERSTEGIALLRDLTAWASERYEVDPHVLRAAAQTEHPSGVVAVLKLPMPPPLERQREATFGVILDAVSDPGNAGTIARTALAAGAGFLVSTEHSVDLFAPKVVRAGMGAHFRLPLYSSVAWDELRHTLNETTFVAAAADAEQSVYHFIWPTHSALVVGSEAHGLSPEAVSSVHMRVRIPMQPGVESLNAAIAAGILIYAARSPILASETLRYK